MLGDYICEFKIPVLNVFYYPTGNAANPQYRIGDAQVEYIS